MSTNLIREFLVFERPARLQRSPLPAAAAVGSRVESARLVGILVTQSASGLIVSAPIAPHDLSPE